MANITNKDIVAAYFEQVLDDDDNQKLVCKGCQIGEDETPRKLYKPANNANGNGNQNLASHVKKAHAAD